MSISSINTNQAALVAQLNIGTATTSVSNNVTALSSGNRIVNASTDVAALSTGTALQSQVNTLNTALTVASQGSSLLQVADGALAQIQNILQRQQAIATSAQSGSLSDTQRGFLDQEFQTLTQQIDQLAGSTNFNGVNLLNGSLSQKLNTTVNSNVASTTNTASGTYTVTTAAANADSITINGQSFTLTTTAISGSTAANTIYVGSSPTTVTTATNIVATINAVSSNNGSTPSSANVYSNLDAAHAAALAGIIATQTTGSSSFTLTARNGGTLGNAITLGTQGSSNTLVVASTGQGTGSSSSITGINVASTSSLLGSQVSGGLLLGSGITFGGATVTGSITSANSTLDSLVASINANTSTSNVRAFVTGSSGNYTLNLVSTSTSAANISNNPGATNALSLSKAATQLTSVAGGGADNGVLGISAVGGTNNTNTTQTLTFHQLANGANTVLTESNSSLQNGAVNFTLTGGTSLSSSNVNVVLGSTTLQGLFNQITAVSGYSGSTLTASGTDMVLVINGASGSAAHVAGTDGLAGVDASTHNDSAAFKNYSSSRLADTNYVIAGSTTVNNTNALTGGVDNAMGFNSVTATGPASSLNPILVNQNQSQSVATISYPSILPSDNSSFTVGTGASAVTFNFTSTASGSATEIQIGSTLQQTLANAAAKINAFAANSGTGAQKYLFNQLQATSDGSSISISTRNVGAAVQLDITGHAATSTPTVTASGSNAIVSGSLSNGVNNGVNVSGIDNTGFIGSGLGNFTATYDSANTVKLSTTIGGITYTADNVNTNPTTNNETVTFQSTATGGAGGYFTLQLAANQGLAVSSASDTNLTTFVNNLNTAFGGLTFYQNRGISSYTPSTGSAIIANGSAIGSLSGSSLSLNSNNFTNVAINSVNVTAPAAGSTNASITFDVNGVNYVSSGLGSTLAANTSYTLTSVNDPNQFITFKTGSTGIDISNPVNANAVQNAIISAFGAGGGSAISFQVGSDSTQTIGVSIGSATSSSLFGGQTLDVKTLADATTAGTVLTSALNSVTSLRATVGALEERFTFASNAIQSAVQNEGAAKSNLLDTDVASASTAFATAQVQLQAGIAVLAQANQLQQNLLKLIA